MPNQTRPGLFARRGEVRPEGSSCGSECRLCAVKLSTHLSARRPMTFMHVFLASCFSLRRKVALPSTRGTRCFSVGRCVCVRGGARLV